jgi:diguanylate cyclase (GGDEF)-like protein
LRELSSHDPLTGVLNARAISEAGDLLIRSGLRVGTPFSVVFIDLDHFKSINDRHGHEVGDLVLKEVANCLAQHTRRSDLFGRVGGEEFMMLLPNTDLSGAKLLAEKLRQHVEELAPLIGSERIPVTVSIGVARNRSGQESIADIRREADQAMYRAKAEGRNRVVSLEKATSG